MLFKTSSVLLLAVVGSAGCAEVCPDGQGDDMYVLDGEIRIRGSSLIGSTNTSLGTLDAPDEQLSSCENVATLRFFGPINGPLTPFDNLNSLGLLEFNWMDVDEIDAFPNLTTLGELYFQGYTGGDPDPNRGEDDFIPPNAEQLRVGRIGGFPKLEAIRSVRHFGSGTTGDWVGFGSLKRIDSFDFSEGTSATTLEAFSTVESMGELLIRGGRVPSDADFRSLATVEGDFSLSSMARLRTLGFDALESVGGDVTFANLGLREWNGLANLTLVGGAGDFRGIGCVSEGDFEAWAAGVSFADGYVASRFGVLIGEENCED